MGKVPVEEMAPKIGLKSKDVGPKVKFWAGLRGEGWPATLGLRVKIAMRLFDALALKFVSARSCRASTGRFWVTTWPKLDPNTPMSKPRPYPMRTTVLGSN